MLKKENRKNKKRVVAMVLALAMLITGFTTVPAAKVDAAAKSTTKTYVGQGVITDTTTQASAMELCANATYNLKAGKTQSLTVGRYNCRINLLLDGKRPDHKKYSYSVSSSNTKVVKFPKDEKKYLPN